MLDIVCHFYNEEYLLPWWLTHHKKFVRHAIMIDYNSTDRSREIIQEICPTWQIVTTRNSYFDSAAIDREVEDYEAELSSWRMALNVTEFLYGNVAQLTDSESCQKFVSNYVFVDPMNDLEPSYQKPLHEQITWGYYESSSPTHRLNTGVRCSRSIHNHKINYHHAGGRHWSQLSSFDDLAIFYYGYAILNERSLARKLQIKTKMSDTELRACGGNHPNTLGQDQFLANIDHYHRPRCEDLSEKIKPIIGYNYE